MKPLDEVIKAVDAALPGLQNTKSMMQLNDALDDYHEAANPANLRTLLDGLKASQERERVLTEALDTLVDRDFTFFSGKMIGASVAITKEQVLAARAALTTPKGPNA